MVTKKCWTLNWSILCPGRTSWLRDVLLLGTSSSNTICISSTQICIRSTRIFSLRPKAKLGVFKRKRDPRCRKYLRLSSQIKDLLQWDHLGLTFTLQLYKNRMLILSSQKVKFYSIARCKVLSKGLKLKALITEVESCLHKIAKGIKIIHVPQACMRFNLWSPI